MRTVIAIAARPATAAAPSAASSKAGTPVFTLPVLLVLSPGVTCETVSGTDVLSFVLSSTEVEPPGVMIYSAPLTTPSTILSPFAADADKPHKLIAAMEANIAAVFFIPFFLSFILFIRISVSVLLFGIFIINMLCVIIMSV